MRNLRIAASAVAAGIFVLAAVILAFYTFDSTAPTASAQPSEPLEACPDPETNARCLIIRKETSPASDQSFAFTHNHDGVNTNFNLSDGEQAIFTFSDIDPHTVTETVPAGWSLTITCAEEEQQGVDLVIQQNQNRIIVSMEVGATAFATATCVFTNTQDPTATPTATPTITLTPTATATATVTATATATATATNTATATATSTTPATATPTGTLVAATSTPGAPKVGTGSSPGGGSSLPLLLAAFGAALALAGGGFALRVARVR